MRLEIAGRRLHGRALSPVDGLQGQVVDALAPLEGRQLLLPRGEALGLARDLFRVDGVGLHPGPRIRLVVAGSLERILLVADLHLQALPSARLAGDRAKRLEGARLLFDLQGRCIAHGRQRLARLLANQPIQLCLESLDLADVRLLAGEQVLGLGEVGQSERLELLLQAGFGQAQLGFHLRSTAQASIDLDIAELPLHLAVSPEPQTTAARTKPIAATTPPAPWMATPRSAIPRVFAANEPAAITRPRTTRAIDQRDSGCQVAAGVTSNWTSTSPESSLELPDSLVHGAKPIDRPANNRQGMGRRVRRGETVDFRADVHSLSITLVALARRRALRTDPFSLTGLFHEVPMLRQCGLGIGPAVSGCRERIAIQLELGQGQRALLQGDPCLAHGLVGDLEPSGVALALGHQVVQGTVELAARPTRAAIGAADRRLQSIAQGPFVAGQVADLEMTDRGGRTEEGLGRDTGQLRQHLVGQGRVGDRLAVVVEAHRPLAAGERLLDRARLAAVLVVLLEFDRDDRSGPPAARPTDGAPRARRPCSWPGGSGPARALAGRWSCRLRSVRARRSGRARRRCRARGSAGNPGR